ncbi:hypothetical protein ABZ567_28445 [Streptomyces sp. NPDC016459]|uniref:hypothetical protein n=1 Tax=Streptomyces sp. NPDC016459 TaxID=3157190 RepID=UPI0034057C05
MRDEKLVGMSPLQPFASDWNRAAVPESEQWNWLAVEIAEVQRCAAVGDQAHDRLALILLDHLVEVIIGREVNVRLTLQIADKVIEEMREFREAGGELEDSLSLLVDKHVGPERRKKLDDHLPERTKYLVQMGVLSAAERDVLDRLHEYRNAAYHRDTLEGDLISDLVLAYRVLANELLARHKPLAWTMAASGGQKIVTPQQLRGRLVEGVEVDLRAMAGRFHSHMVERVQAIASAVGEAGNLLGAGGDEEPQVPAADDEMGRMLTELRAVSKQLPSWTKRAEGLRSKASSLAGLMAPFINLDRELRRIEPSVKRLEMITDYWVQQQIDEIRGK